MPAFEMILPRAQVIVALSALAGSGTRGHSQAAKAGIALGEKQSSRARPAAQVAIACAAWVARRGRTSPTSG